MKKIDNNETSSLVWRTNDDTPPPNCIENGFDEKAFWEELEGTFISFLEKSK